jgi:hypothetical protein
MTWFALRIHGKGLSPQRTDGANGKPVPLRAWLDKLDRDPEPPPFPAEVALCRSGYMPFVPTERWQQRRHRHAKGKVWMMKPLIPGFALVFIEKDWMFNWFRLMSTPYVLGTYGRLTGIPDRSVAAIAAMEKRMWSNNPYGLKVGDSADIEIGSLRGREILITKVISETPKPVLQGLVEMFGSSVSIEIPLEFTKGSK